MPGENAELQRELNEVKGGLDLIDDLREELTQWVDEAEDDSKREALENVLGHIENIEREYKRRQEELQKKLGSA
jgi:F0F1-type ATP synthase membrane subunit b/b'